MVKDYLAVLGFSFGERQRVFDGDWETLLKTRYQRLIDFIYQEHSALSDSRGGYGKHSAETFDLLTEVAEAYTTLADPKKRLCYVLQLHLAVQKQEPFEKTKTESFLRVYADREWGHPQPPEGPSLDFWV